MIPNGLRCFIICALFVAYVGYNLYSWWVDVKKHWKVDKIKKFFSRLAICSYLFMFLASFTYRFTNYRSLNCDTWLVELFSWFADSLQFAINGMTTGLLVDDNIYTVNLLNDFIICNWYSPAYFFICIVLTIAPLSTAGWLISAVDVNLGARLRLMRGFMRQKFVFYSPSDRSIMLANHIEESFRTAGCRQKPLLVFCRSAFNQENATLEKRNEIRRLQGVPVEYTERDYVYKDSENVLILCAKNLNEVNEFIPPHYYFPENIKKTILLSDEACSEIDLVKRVVEENSKMSRDCAAAKTEDESNNNMDDIKGENDKSTDSQDAVPKVKTYSVWETNCEIAYEKLTTEINQSVGNGFIVGEGNILPVALVVLRDCFSKHLEKDKSEWKKTCNEITAFPLQREIYYKIKPEMSISGKENQEIKIRIVKPSYSGKRETFDLICEYIESNTPGVRKWLALVSENGEDNTRRKRLFCKKYRNEIENNNLRIIVYCRNLLEIQREQVWDKANNVEEIEYIGDDETAIKWLYDKKIRDFLNGNS